MLLLLCSTSVSDNLIGGTMSSDRRILLKLNRGLLLATCVLVGTSAFARSGCSDTCQTAYTSCTSQVSSTRTSCYSQATSQYSTCMTSAQIDYNECVLGCPANNAGMCTQNCAYGYQEQAAYCAYGQQEQDGGCDNGYNSGMTGCNTALTNCQAHCPPN